MFEETVVFTGDINLYRGYEVERLENGFKFFHEGKEILLDTENEVMDYIDEAVMEKRDELFEKFNPYFEELKKSLENFVDEKPTDDELDIMFGYWDSIERSEYEDAFNTAYDLLLHLTETLNY